ncbi:F-box/kelch-repeat protein SKIP6-like [Wolffia australiana]
MEEARWRSERETPIPGLPADLAMECIARIPFFFHPELALVSRSWRSALQSPDLFAIRVLAGATKPFLCVDVRTRSNPTNWFLLDPSSSSVVPLPPPPIRAAGSACASIGHLLFVLGGATGGIATPAVQIYDARANRWRRGPKMRAAREFAAAGAVGGRVYVAGGCLPSTEPWAEVLDMEEGRWRPLASPIAIREKWIHGSAVLGGKLLAMADRGGLQFDPEKGRWSAVSEVLDRGWKGRAAAVDRVIYSYDFLGKVKGFDPEMGEWREVEGVDQRLPKFLAGAMIADLGGVLCLAWEGGRGGGKMMCAAVKVEKKERRLMGEILWKEMVELGAPADSSLSHCLSLHV